MFKCLKLPHLLHRQKLKKNKTKWIQIYHVHGFKDLMLLRCKFSQANEYIQYHISKNPNMFFCRNWQGNSRIYKEKQRTYSNKNNLIKEKQKATKAKIDK